MIQVLLQKKIKIKEREQHGNSQTTQLWASKVAIYLFFNKYMVGAENKSQLCVETLVLLHMSQSLIANIYIYISIYLI